MKKLTSQEQKSIMGGGPCTPLCGNTYPSGATYTGDCSLPLPNCGGTYMYIITPSCGTDPVTFTYCYTGLNPD